MSNTQQPEALNLEEFRAKVTRAAREPLLARIAELEEQLSAIGAGGVEPLRKQAVRKAAAPQPPEAAQASVSNGTLAAHVMLPCVERIDVLEVAKELKENISAFGDTKGKAKERAAFYLVSQHEQLLYWQQQVRQLLSTGVQAQAVPIGWREQFATEVYADLEAADNQDVPLEEYPARILKVLDSTVGPRHPVVIKWRNDAIEQCIAIALKYCRDPESHKYLKQDLEAMLASAPAHPAEGVPVQVVELEVDDLIDRLLNAQQDLNLAANVHMDQSIASASTLLDEVEIALRTLAATHPTQQGLDARDAAFEAVRKAFCNLQRYSFWLDSRGNVRRCADRSGNWVEFEAAHTLFEPQSVDAALAAQAKQGELP